MTSDQGHWATAGSADANDVYLGNRLQYRDAVDTRITGTVTGQMLKPIFLRFIYCYLILIVISYVLGAVFLILALTGGTSGEETFGTTDDDGGGIIGGVAGLIGLAWWLLPFLVFLMPQRLPISEWSLLLDGKAAAAPSAYAQIFESLRRRSSPLTAEAKPIVTSFAPRKEGYYLVLKHNRFTGYVSVFDFGKDLYVGWSMWWELIPIVMIGLYISQTFSGLFGANSSLHQVLRADPIKAFREVIHSSTREGVDAANAGVERSIPETFGYELPFEQMPVARGPSDFLVVQGSGSSRVPVPPRPAGSPARPTTPPQPHGQHGSTKVAGSTPSERPDGARRKRPVPKAPPPSPDSRLD